MRCKREMRSAESIAIEALGWLDREEELDPGEKLQLTLATKAIEHAITDARDAGYREGIAAEAERVHWLDKKTTLAYLDYDPLVNGQNPEFPPKVACGAGADKVRTTTWLRKNVTCKHCIAALGS